MIPYLFPNLHEMAWVAEPGVAFLLGITRGRLDVGHTEIAAQYLANVARIVEKEARLAF